MNNEKRSSVITSPAPTKEGVPVIRIGVDGHVLTGKYQGTRSTLTALLRSLAARLSNQEVIVYTHEPDEAEATVGKSRIRFTRLPPVGSIKRLMQTFPRYFKRDGIDIGVFQYMIPLLGRHVVFIHDILPITHPKLFPLFMRLRTRIFFWLAIKKAIMVIAVSEYTRSEVERLYNVPANRLKTVLNGPSFPGETYLGGHSPAGPPYILSVGRVEPRKNIHLLVEAFLLADLKNVRLVIVGSHDNGFKYSIPEDDRIVRHQGISDERLVELYRGASLFVYPSSAEGFGIPLLDALLFGIPVISSSLTAMAEIATGNACLFDPTDSHAREGLATKLFDHFNGNRITAPTVSQRATLAKRFNWDRAAESLLAAIDASHNN